MVHRIYLEQITEMTPLPLKKIWYCVCFTVIFLLLFQLSSISILSPPELVERRESPCNEFWVIWQRGDVYAYRNEGHNFSRRIYWVANQTLSDLDEHYYQATIPSLEEYTVVRAGHMSLMRYNGTYYMADAFYDGRTYRRMMKSSPSGERHSYAKIISYDSESYRPVNDFVHINESEAWLITTKKDGNVIKKVF